MAEDPGTPGHGTDAGPLRWRGFEVLAHWGWVFDYDEGYASGEFLLLAHGALMTRPGGDQSDGYEHFWAFGPWEPKPRWTPEPDPGRAGRVLRDAGYGLALPSPTPPDASVSRRFPGIPAPATFLVAPDPGAGTPAGSEGTGR